MRVLHAAWKRALSAKGLELIAQISKKVYRAFQDLKGPRRLDNTDSVAKCL